MVKPVKVRFSTGRMGLTSQNEQPTDSSYMDSNRELAVDSSYMDSKRPAAPGIGVCVAGRNVDDGVNINFEGALGTTTFVASTRPVHERIKHTVVGHDGSAGGASSGPKRSEGSRATESRTAITRPVGRGSSVTGTGKRSSDSSTVVTTPPTKRAKIQSQDDFHQYDLYSDLYGTGSPATGTSPDSRSRLKSEEFDLYGDL